MLLPVHLVVHSMYFQVETDVPHRLQEEEANLGPAFGHTIEGLVLSCHKASTIDACPTHYKLGEYTGHCPVCEGDAVATVAVFIVDLLTKEEEIEDVTLYTPELEAYLCELGLEGGDNMKANPEDTNVQIQVYETYGKEVATKIVGN